MRSGHVVLLFGGLLGPLVGTAEPQVTPFRQDVTDAIDAGLTWFRNSTIYSDVGFAPQAKGLALGHCSSNGRPRTLTRRSLATPPQCQQIRSWPSLRFRQF